MVNLDAETLQRVELQTGVSLTGEYLAESMMRIGSDNALMSNVVYQICKPEADRRGINYADFMLKIFLNCIEVSCHAVCRELASGLASPLREHFLNELANNKPDGV